MKKWMKWGIVLALVFIAGIQFIRPARNLPLATGDTIPSAAVQMPKNIQTIVQHSCYDCHSNTTQYPWYASIQPVGWLLSQHITGGKHELNFDEFYSYRLRKQYRKLKEIEHEVQQGDMPLPSYLFIHRDARLSDDQKSLILAWCESVRDSLKACYPADSLESPKHMER